jgi:hypothetical protein
MINIEHYSEEYNFNVDVLKIAFGDMDFYSGKKNVILSKLSELLRNMNGKQILHFDTQKPLLEQFCHSCCHILAEHLVYLLHEQDGFEVAHIQIIYALTIHSCVEVKWEGKSYYVDAEGIFVSLEDILKRYEREEININSVDIVRRTGFDIIDDGDNEEVRKLTELTAFWVVSSNLADDEEFENPEDVEDNALNNIILEMLSKY